MGKGMLVLLSIGVGIVALVIIGVNDYLIDRDITSWLGRVETSSDAEDMLAYMRNVQAGMEAWDMTDGHAALLYKTADNDMGLIYEAVKDHVANLEQLEQMDPNTPQYQTLIDRLQDSIVHMEIPASHYWNTHEGIAWWIILVVCVLVFLGVMLSS
jgi:hypothetical protein